MHKKRFDKRRNNLNTVPKFPMNTLFLDIDKYFIRTIIKDIDYPISKLE